MLKKCFILTSLLAISIFVIQYTGMSRVGAATENDVFQACSQGAAADSEFCKNSGSSATRRAFNPFGESGIFVAIVQVITWLIGIVSIIMIIIGGFRYIASGGDSNGISGAKNTIIYAVVGLIVTLFAQLIVTYVLSKV